MFQGFEIESDHFKVFYCQTFDSKPESGPGRTRRKSQISFSAKQLSLIERIQLLWGPLWIPEEKPLFKSRFDPKNSQVRNSNITDAYEQ